MPRMALTTERTQPQSPPEDRRLRYRADIQGLRALAVLAVIANHLAGWPRGSFDGVDVFFVISGYLITGILLREFEARETISSRRFYARRIKRILPVGLFVIGATLCATRVLAGIDRYHFAAKDAIAAVLFVANWRFAHTGVNYFNQALPPSPLQHYWSLSVEEQFYFVWPWLMLGLLLIGFRLRFWRRDHARLVAGVAIAVISAVSLWLAFAQTASNPTVAYFSTFDRAWELGLGALIAIAARPLGRWDPRLRLLVALAGLIGVLVSLFVVRSSPGFPAPWALLPSLASGSNSTSAASPGWPTAIRRPSTDAAMACATVIACSGCHGSSPGSPRCTAVAIASHGSSGATGASEPRATSTPWSSSERSMKQRSARSAHTRSVVSWSSRRCAG